MRTTVDDVHSKPGADSRLAAEPLVPAGPVTGFVGGTADSVRGVWRYRELLDLLVRRELKSRYKDSALGFLWSLIRPLTQLLVYYIAIGKFLGAERSIPDFAIYIFTGLTAWGLFSEIISAGTGSIVANGGLVKKIYLPREVFPLSVIGSAFFNFVDPVRDPADRRADRQRAADRWPAGATSLLGTVRAAGLRHGRGVPAVRGQRLPAGRAVPGRGRADGRVLDLAHRLRLELRATTRCTRELLNALYLANPVTLAVLAFQRGLWVAGADAPPAHRPGPAHR